MLKIIFTSFISLYITACLSTSTILIPPTQPKPVLSQSTILKIAIPVREYGYRTFDTQVLTTNNEFNNFIEKVKKEKGWNQKENFLSSLTLYPIDFTKYNLLLYRMTESSSSTVLAVDIPKGTDEHIVIEIGRDKPNSGTTDMAYYALAYRVAKSVKDITFDNGIKKHVIKNRALRLLEKVENK